ncbi:MAG: hypothetical protein KF681_04020 [Bdellovibrionaceae bacterium]|nr:hypothetical protein [Pseudobdellovibrionaceae bacterium]
MIWLRGWLLTSSILVFSLGAHAGVAGTLFGTYISDDFSQTAATSDSKQLYGGLLLASVTAKDTFHIGWAYTSINATSTKSSVTDTFASTDMGPAFAYWFGKNRILNISGAYNVVSNSTFQQGSTATKEWTGTSYWVAVGADLEWMKNLHLGGRIIYYSTSITDQKIGSAATSVSVGRTWVMPMLTITYRP